VGCIGGWSVRSDYGRVQRASEGRGAWRCCCGVPLGWAGVALRRHHHAVQVPVKNGLRRGRGAREWYTRSRHAGRAVWFTSTWMVRRARSCSSGLASGNRSVGSRQVGRQGDSVGGERWRADPIWSSRWSWRRPGRAWGGGMSSLRDGARLGFLQVRRVLVGGSRWWVIEERGVLAGWPLAPPSSLDAK
jgi:hypothetical protein